MGGGDVTVPPARRPTAARLPAAARSGLQAMNGYCGGTEGGREAYIRVGGRTDDG